MGVPLATSQLDNVLELSEMPIFDHSISFVDNQEFDALDRSCQLVVLMIELDTADQLQFLPALRRLSEVGSPRQ